MTQFQTQVQFEMGSICQGSFDKWRLFQTRASTLSAPEQIELLSSGMDRFPACAFGFGVQPRSDKGFRPAVSGHLVGMQEMRPIAGLGDRQWR